MSTMAPISCDYIDLDVVLISLEYDQVSHSNTWDSCLQKIKRVDFQPLLDKTGNRMAG